MQRSFPGFLYAKSLFPGDALEEGYRTWFLNPALKPHEGRIASLRDTFRWRTDSSRKHPPVMVVEPVAGTGDVLVIRFSDAGKDSFGRSQTLRMEALLAPAEHAAAFWDGTFAAKPDATSAEFNVDARPSASDFPGLGDERLINGDAANFSLAGYAKQPLPRPSPAPEAIRKGPEVQSVPSPPPPQPPPAHSKMRKPFFIVLLALFASIAVNVWLWDKSANERDTLQDRLSQTERQLKDLQDQMAGVEAERSALATFKSQSDAFAEALKDLQSVAARLEGIRTSMEGLPDEKTE
jgi:hypothetical protein